MITSEQYFGPHIKSPDATIERKTNAVVFLNKCAKLESMLLERGVVFETNPKTKSGVSGVTFGGFRPQSCPQGAPGSSHKEGRGVDRYDPYDKIDSVLQDDYEKCKTEGREDESMLVIADIYIEHPNSTLGWSHWTDRAPKSGKRIFLP